MGNVSQPYSEVARHIVKALDEVHPKDIMGYYFSPDKRVYVGSVVLRDVPGALAGVATALGKEGINLVASESANIEGTRTSSWGFFAEAEDSVDIGKIRALIEATGYALKIDIPEGADGVVVDRYHYPPKFTSGHQVMMLRREDMVDMFNRIRKIFGSGANVIIYEMGMAAGESDAKELAESMGKERVVGNLLELVYLYLAQGWGLPEVTDLTLDPLRAMLRFKDCFECVSAKSSTPNSHYLGGHLVGLAWTIFGTRVKCTETRCVSMGDPYCEFSAEETGNVRKA
jgi:predicted hydrocarbon binding protein